MDHGIEIGKVLAEHVILSRGDEEGEQQGQTLAVPVVNAALWIEAIHGLSDDLKLLWGEGASEQGKVQMADECVRLQQGGGRRAGGLGGGHDHAHGWCEIERHGILGVTVAPAM